MPADAVTPSGRKLFALVVRELCLDIEFPTGELEYFTSLVWRTINRWKNRLLLPLRHGVFTFPRVEELLRRRAPYFGQPPSGYPLVIILGHRPPPDNEDPVTPEPSDSGRASGSEEASHQAYVAGTPQPEDDDDDGVNWDDSVMPEEDDGDPDWEDVVMDPEEDDGDPAWENLPHFAVDPNLKVPA